MRDAADAADAAASAKRARDAGVDWPEFVFGGSFERGELCALVAHDGWAAVAIGRFTLSSADALLNWGGFNHGVAVEASTDSFQ